MSPLPREGWHRPRKPPTQRQLEVLAAVLMYGYEEGAARVGITKQSAQNSVSLALDRLQARNSVEAAMLLGWLVVPLAYRPYAEVVTRRTWGVDKSTV